MIFGDLDKQCKNPIERGIRTAFKRSQRYQDCFNASRVTTPKYKIDGTRAKRDNVFRRCNICKKLFKNIDVQIDHIIPVIPFAKKLDDLSINQLLNRIWNLPIQVACKTCHKAKTKKENVIRKAMKS